ncbi:MAG TPA: diacylglycerol kinase family protein [Chitinophagaceae bacterium]|nr:diacylglycerol kinase family protein [Chitinophagaceae bacterium]
MSVEKNISIVCNSLAGGGKAIGLSRSIAKELQRRNIRNTLYSTEWPGHFNSYTDVWIVGGDGTLNYFFNKYPGIRLPLVVFKGGTGNDVHAVLYKSQSFEEQLHVALTAAPKPVDAGRCNERYFINGVGIGFEGAVAKSLTGKKKKKSGKAAFMGTILRKVFFYTSKKYKTVSNEYSIEGQRLLISVMNGHRAGGGFHIAPESAIDDGLFDVVLVDKLHPFQRLRWLPVIEKGKHLELSFIKSFRTKKLIITSEEKMDTHLDGEYYSAKRLEIEMLPSKYLFRY